MAPRMVLLQNKLIHITKNLCQYLNQCNLFLFVLYYLHLWLKT